MAVIVAATDAKNRFGQLLEAARTGPVVIEKSGRPHSVLLSAEAYEALREAAAAQSARGDAKRFYREHRAWVDALNADTAQNGVWSDRLRTW